MTYSEISKSIGWDTKHISIPTEDEIVKLIEEAKKKNENSFVKLFEILRFAKPNNKEEIRCVNLAYDGHELTRELFR